MSKSKAKAPVASKKIFSENLKYLLQQKNITHLEFALEENIERHRVERWIKGLCFPKYTIMVQICQFFEYYDIYKLITERINAKKPND